MGDISICTAGHDPGHDPGQALLACARQLGAQVSCETVTGISLTPGQAGPGGLLSHNRNHWAIETVCTIAATPLTAKTPAGSAPAVRHA